MFKYTMCILEVQLCIENYNFVEGCYNGPYTFAIQLFGFEGYFNSFGD